MTIWLITLGYKHTLGICNSYFLSSAKMVARKHLHITLYSTLPAFLHDEHTFLDLLLHATPSFTAVFTWTRPYTLPWTGHIVNFITSSLLISSLMCKLLLKVDSPYGLSFFPPNYECISNLSHPCYMTCSYHCFWFHHLNKIRRWTRIMKGFVK